MKRDHFITSFGRRIDFIPGFKDAHPKVTARDIFYEDGNVNYTINEYQFQKDLYEALFFLDFMGKTPAPLVFDSLLDLGGEEGTVARLLAAFRKTRHVTCLDKRDLRNCLNDGLFQEYLKRVETPNIYFADLEKEFGFNANKAFSFWRNMGNYFKAGAGHLDEYICGDFFEQKEKYDCITAFLCASWFSLPELFNKVSSLLTPGGIFFFINDYWWWPVNSTGIVGDFPYCAQRLHREDLKRYFDENYSEETDDTLRRYDYFHNGIHPTVDCYIEHGKYYNLKLLRSERLMPFFNKIRTPYNPLSSTVYSHLCYNEEDLMTAFVAMAFIKV